MPIRPERLWDQYEGKLRAELLRGSGWWPTQPEPCALEPPWAPYNMRELTPWDCVVNNWEAPYETSQLRCLLNWGETIHAIDSHLRLHPVPMPDLSELAVISVEQFPEDDSTIPKAEQLLHALSALRHSVAFELVGVGAQPEYDPAKIAEMSQARGFDRIRDAISGWTEPYTTTQFAVHRSDRSLLEQQLAIHYPNSAVVADSTTAGELQTLVDLGRNPERSTAAVLALECSYAFPLRVFTRLDPDPIAVAIAAMESLGREDWALLQILFEPARESWADTLQDATVHPYTGDSWLERDELRLLRAKLASPLFAVSIRLLASRPDVFRHLVGWSEQFANPPHQRLVVDDADRNGRPLEPDEQWAFETMAAYRTTFSPGILLNAEELASLMHLPTATIPTERLRRVNFRTRPVVETTVAPGSVELGQNVHRGITSAARIPAELRPRHCYAAGASGTGKSTLLLNMILQDIRAGCGVAVLDPHGDLISDVICRIPENRVDDVIYFDPADQQYPFALNILEAKDEDERERIVQETIMALEKYFPASWGPRLERILMFTLHTVINAIPGATLADVERMLTDIPYRDYVVSRCTNSRFVHFWNHEMPLLPKNACDPVLNKLSPFLTSRVVRNIICQRNSAIEFDSLINQGKILLANLSTGLLTERISGMFGSFLVTKLVNATFRRAHLPREQRRPFYLYIDEFQSFMNLSIGFERILAEARKYQLVLTMANQYVGQLTPQVRQAIFGNVGVMIVFRLGVDDSHTAAKEMGVFTAEEIMNLERGQAIVRAGGSATAHNVQTYPPPDAPADDPSPEIIARMRQHYAKPRALVEEQLQGTSHQPSSSTTAASEDSQARIQQRKKRRHKPPQPASAADPSEDDLVQ